MKGFLSYIPGNSPLHRMNPLIKLLLALVICAACFITSNHFYLLALIALTVGLGAVGGIHRAVLKTLTKLLKLGCVLLILQIFFIRDGRVLLSLPPGLIITDAGLKFSLLLSLRLVAATLPLTLMLQATQISDLTREMVSKLRIPYRYVFAFTTALRFIPVLSEEMAGIMQAQTARGVEFDGGLIRKIRLLLPMTVPLLVSSVQRIEQSAISAELRGFHLRGRVSGFKRYPLRAPDLCALALCALVLVGGFLIPGL